MMYRFPLWRLALILVLSVFLIGTRAMACPMGSDCCEDIAGTKCAAMASGGTALCKAACATLLPDSPLALLAPIAAPPFTLSTRFAGSHVTVPEPPPPKTGA